MQGSRHEVISIHYVARQLMCSCLVATLHRFCWPKQSKVLLDGVYHVTSQASKFKHCLCSTLAPLPYIIHGTCAEQSQTRLCVRGDVNACPSSLCSHCKMTCPVCNQLLADRMKSKNCICPCTRHCTAACLLHHLPKHAHSIECCCL